MTSDTTQNESLKDIARTVKFLLENMRDPRLDSAVEWVRDSAASELREHVHKMNEIIGDEP